MPSSRPSAAQVVELACRAPSVHNTQPWAWRIEEQGDGYRVELWADRTRQLDVADPSGRNLVLSCGAALHHARVAATSLGFVPVVDRQPDPARPDLLAVVDLTRSGRASTVSGELHVLLARRTDRRRFTSWPVEEEHLRALTRGLARDGVQAVPLVGVGDRVRSGLLVERAASVQARDERYAAEERRWSDRPRTSTLAAADRLVAVCSEDDGPAAWLVAGEVLSELWLRAAHDGLSVVPISQVVEVEETRRLLHHEVLGGLVHPQLLLRLGWQELSRSDLPATPRRPLAEVLLEPAGPLVVPDVG